MNRTRLRSKDWKAKWRSSVSRMILSSSLCWSYSPCRLQWMLWTPATRHWPCINPRELQQSLLLSTCCMPPPSLFTGFVYNTSIVFAMHELRAAGLPVAWHAAGCQSIFYCSPPVIRGGSFAVVAVLQLLAHTHTHCIAVYCTVPMQALAHFGKTCFRQKDTLSCYYTHTHEAIIGKCSAWHTQILSFHSHRYM